MRVGMVTYALLSSTCACAHGSLPASTHEPPGARFEVTFFDNLDGALVRACFTGFVPDQLVPIDDGSNRSLAWASSGGRRLAVRSGRVELGSQLDGGCLSYRTHFSREVFRTRDSRTVVVSQAQWLWRPMPFPDGMTAQVSLTLPSEADAALPFPKAAGAYALGEDAFRRSAYTVFGSFERDRFRFGATDVVVAKLGPRPDTAAVREWLTVSMRAAASVGKGLPVDQILFVIVPVEATDRPVAFGMVRRGGGASVLLIASRTASARALAADWVAVHELSHLWLPRLRRQDRWLTEGIATYLQELLRARCSIQSGEVSWRRIREGLERGRHAGTGRALTRESQDMNRTGAYYRVYWAGTAFAFDADVRLRLRSGGRTSLVGALEAAQPRWKGEGRLFRADEVLSALDEVSGTDFLTELGDRYASGARFPSVPAFDDPSAAEMRRSIMAPQPERCDFSVESYR